MTADFCLIICRDRRARYLCPWFGSIVAIKNCSDFAKDRSEYLKIPRFIFGDEEQWRYDTFQYSG